MITPSVAQVIRATGTPDFVKGASFSEDGNYDFRTKEAAYVSYVKALIKQASGPEMEDCTHHARFWGIEMECAKAKQKFAELMTAPELTDDDYAVLIPSAGGRKIQKFAAYDPSSTVQAAIAFYEQREKFPYSVRNEAATTLLHKAASYKVILPEYVQRYLEKAAALGAFDAQSLEDALIERDQSCNSDFKEQFEKVAVLLEDVINHEKLRTDHEFIKNACAVVDQYDAHSGFKGGLIEEAIGDDLIASQLSKIAADQRFTIKLVNGHELDVRELKKEALAAVSPSLGIMAHVELVDVLPTLPRGDADLLTKIVS